MVEIEKGQLRDTRLNVQSTFARPLISPSNFGIFKDTQWHTGLPYKTNQFHVQQDSLFLSKRPVLVHAWKNYFLSAQSNFNYCRKVLSMKNILINIKTKKCTPKSVLRWEFASVYVQSLFCLFQILTITMPVQPRSWYHPSCSFILQLSSYMFKTTW